MELCVAQSFSKSFGLYGQRVGAFHLLSHDPSGVPAIRSNLVRLIRSEYSSPSSWGAKVVAIILEDPALAEEWRQDLRTMNTRIKSMRKALVDELTRLGTPGSWGHIVDQVSVVFVNGYRILTVMCRLACSRTLGCLRHKPRGLGTSIMYICSLPAGYRSQDVRCQQ